MMSKDKMKKTKDGSLKTGNSFPKLGARATPIPKEVIENLRSLQKLVGHKKLSLVPIKVEWRVISTPRFAW